MKNRKAEKLVQFGCGQSCPDGWENYDSSTTVILQRLPFAGKQFAKRSSWKVDPRIKKGDIVKGLPVGEEMVDAVYCSHVLEHLALEEFYRALQNTYRSLKGGGVFRGVVPDLESRAKDYLDSSGPDSSHEFLRSTLLGEEKREKTFKGILKYLFEGSKHRWMWDYPSMEEALLGVGFSTVRRAYFGDSAWTCFRDVEDQGRWDGELGFEAVK